jgi:hypothetical protein
MAAILTDYSRARNPNLQRALDIDTGKINVSDHAPGRSTIPGTGGGIGASAGTAGTMDPLSLPDIPVYNLYIIFLENQIMDIKIESLDGTKF